MPPDVLARAGLPHGARVLAAAGGRDGAWLLGTRDALVVLAPDGAGRAVPWERVASAEWANGADRLEVVEVADFGEPQPTHVHELDAPGDLLTLVRERVTASIVLQRRVRVDRRGFTVVGRRAPDAGDQITWAVELDPGLDPADPQVRGAVDTALRAAVGEVGGA